MAIIRVVNMLTNAVAVNSASAGKGSSSPPTPLNTFGARARIYAMTMNVLNPANISVRSECTLGLKPNSLVSVFMFSRNYYV